MHFASAAKSKIGICSNTTGAFFSFFLLMRLKYAQKYGFWRARQPIPDKTLTSQRN
jgi:hypothetical protein